MSIYQDVTTSNRILQHNLHLLLSALLTYVLQWCPDMPSKAGKGLFSSPFPGAIKTGHQGVLPWQGLTNHASLARTSKQPTRQCKRPRRLHAAWHLTPLQWAAMPAQHAGGTALHLLFQQTRLRDDRCLDKQELLQTGSERDQRSALWHLSRLEKALCRRRKSGIKEDQIAQA